MLLETLDIKKNDVIVYSHNIFDDESNFKVIFKDEERKKPKKISAVKVFDYINEISPKNLIVYRLLTNVVDISKFDIKLAYRIYINDKTELIYFDPVYAVKELENNWNNFDENELRFRIQQIGLTVIGRVSNLPNYQEIYSIDLKAIEAINQNDKSFVDALFAFNKSDKQNYPVQNNVPQRELKSKAADLSAADKRVHERKKAGQQDKNIYSDKQPTQKKNEIVKSTKHEITQRKSAAHELKNVGENLREAKSGIKLILHKISEDKNFDYKDIIKIGATKKASQKEEVIRKKAGVSAQILNTAITKGSLGAFINKQATTDGDNYLLKSEDSKKVLNIFKSSSPVMKTLLERKNEHFVLKIEE